MQVTHQFVSPKAEQSDHTLVGPNEWNAVHVITGMPFIIASDYNFTPYAGLVPLNPGTNVITFNPPLPTGLSVGSSLYISGGTGTAETVPITGISGNQITVICANAHTGSWVIQSASGGLQEAICSLGSAGGEVWVTQPITLYANVTTCSKTTVKVTKQAASLISGPYTVLGTNLNQIGYSTVSNSSIDYEGVAPANGAQFEWHFNDTTQGVVNWMYVGAATLPLPNNLLAEYKLIYQDIGADSPGSTLKGVTVDYRLEAGQGRTCFAFWCNATAENNWIPSTSGGGLVTNGPIGAGLNAYSKKGGYVAAALLTATADTVAASSVSGMEINVSANVAGCQGKAGILIVDFSTQPVAFGSSAHYGLAITTTGGAQGFQFGINISNGVANGGSIIVATNTPTVANGIDFLGCSFSGLAFRSPGFNVNGAGDTNVNNLTINVLPKFAGNNSTGSGSAALGTNCPAVTLTAPYKWIEVFTADGSAAWIPAWK